MEKQVYRKYENKWSLGNKSARCAWAIFRLCLFRPFFLPVFHQWRNIILCLFGAKIGTGSIIHASAKIWAPWNLEVGQRTCIAPGVICYNPAKIVLGNKVAVSQGTHLCTASHDYTLQANPLITKPIVIQDHSWIAADAFIAPGVTIGQGAVVGARAAIFKDVEPWTVVGGNPAKFIKKRVIKDS